MIDYAKLKQDMAAKGYPVSDGDGWTAGDDNLYRSYLYLNHTGISNYIGKMGHAYTGLLPEGFPGTDDTPVPTLVSLAISGYTDPVAEGSTVQLTATGTYDDSSTADVTASAVWASSDDLVATVAAGLVTGVAAGNATITASIGEIEAQQAVVIEAAAPTLVSVELSAASTTIVESGTTQMTATGTYDDSSTADLTAEVTDWTSSDELVATVDSAGLVTAVGEGTANIGGTHDGVILTPVSITVTAA